MIMAMFDGLCEPWNPNGVGTYGFIVYHDMEVMKKGLGALGHGKGMTNNKAEFTGLLKALQWINRNLHDLKLERIVVKGDSKLVINQLNGKWRVKSDTSRYYVPKISNLVKDLNVHFIWIPRNENIEADRLSQIAFHRYCNAHELNYRIRKR